MVLLNLAKRIPARIAFWATLFLVALAGLPLGCGAGAEAEKTPPATVKWLGASENALEEWTELVGNSMPLPNRVARMSARVEGTVVSVVPPSSDKVVAEGDKIGAGTVLVQLDTTFIKNSLADAELTQEAQVEGQKQAQFAVTLASNEVARIDKVLKEEEDRRLRDGSAPGIPLISRPEREKAAVALQDAQSKLKAANAQVSGGQKKVEALREQLRLHTLVAPIKGRLGRLQVVPGQWLAVGTPVADVIDIDDQIDVLCFVPGSMVHRLEIGQPAHTGGVDAEEGEATGEIVYIAEQAEPETGNFAVKVRFSNKEKHLRANRVVRLTVLTKPGRECLSLPESAVDESEEPPTVVVVEDVQTRKNDKNETEIVGVARRLQVVLGVRDRKLHQVEVISLADPVKKGEDQNPVPNPKDAKFVVEGQQGLQTGDLLKQDTDDE